MSIPVDEITKLNQSVAQLNQGIENLERQLSETKTSLERLRVFAQAIWFDSAHATEDEHGQMKRAHDALRGPGTPDT